MPVRQIPPHPWPSGDNRPIATLALEPAALKARHGLVFEDGWDNLDYVQRAAIELADRSQAWLVRHRGDPAPGTVVYVDAAADFGRARDLVLQALDLTQAAFSWIAPDPEPVAPSARRAS